MRPRLLLLAAALALAACQPAPPPAARDGMAQVFVPAGAFTMGSAEMAPDADPDEVPQHTVYLTAYWIDQTEVTNGMYQACVAAEGCTAPMHSRRYGEAAYANHPVSGVTWYQAAEYCAWAGRRLPTEAEWEKAARGADGRTYPWGEAAPSPGRANYGGGVDDTTEVGRYPAGASPYGALDMAGNVWEWVADAYDPGYYAQSPYSDPPGGISANQRVIRGGSWTTGESALRAANRFWAFPGRNDNDGFRCAANAHP